MILNLFNIFDPNILNIPINIYFSIFLFIYISNNYWLKNNKINFINIILINLIYLNNTFHNKNIIIIYYLLIKILLIINLINLLPYNLSLRTNLIFTLNLTLLFWNIYIYIYI